MVSKDMDENCSDHNFITYNISPKSGFSKTKFRDIAKTDWQIYQDELTKHMTNTADVFNNLITSTDIDKAACQLAANVRSAFNSACKENYASNKVRSPPWETPEVREAKAGIKHRLRQARNTKSDKDWSELRSHQAEYHRLRSHTTKTKFKEFCQTMESKSTPKRISSIIKNQKTTRLGTVRKPGGRLTESPEETLQVMVYTHFTSLNAPPQDNPTGNNRADNHISSGENRSGENHSGDNRTNTTSSSDLDRIFSPKRMKKSLAEFDPLSAAGPDGIRPVMLQKAWETINAAYTNIAKASYRTSHTPVCWRNATGIFLPKPGKGDYYNPKSYRTISLSPVPLKWMERLVLWHMQWKKILRSTPNSVRGSMVSPTAPPLKQPFTNLFTKLKEPS